MKTNWLQVLDGAINGRLHHALAGAAETPFLIDLPNGIERNICGLCSAPLSSNLRCSGTIQAQVVAHIRRPSAIVRYNSGFVSPPGSPAEKAAANKFVNDAIRNDWFRRPGKCQSCRKRSRAGIVGHHPDYSHPDQVQWLCLPCHHQAHRHPEKFAHLPIFVCRDYRKSPPSSPSLAPEGAI